MDVKDFSLEFDLLYNNIMSNKAPGLNEYEKSLFLTQAQELTVLDIYSGKYQEHFEETEKMSMCLDQLIRQETYTSFSTGKRLDINSVFITLPDDLWFKTGEVAYIKDDSYKCDENNIREVTILPVTQDTLIRTKKSPFRGPNEYRILRLNSGKNTVELISKFPLQSYTVRYLSRPSPIILEDLPNGLSINGETTSKTCQLNSAIHRTILNRAVLLAKSIWESETNQR